ncbi:MAG: polymer-forming cytoskeletal protein, partial [Acidobacteria bacterium]|nr:polymer-forming cytoskeletal protein [Acidobacteriota bacterium]
MKNARIALAGLVVVMSALLGSAHARAGNDPGIGIFSDIRVEKGEVLHDDVVCIGGHATVEGKVEGTVVVIGGELDFSGEAEEVVTILSKADFQSGTAVHGDMVHILGEMTKAPDATFEGEKVDVGSALPPRMQRLLSRGIIGLFV